MKTKKRLIKKKSIKYKRGGLKRKYNTGGSQYDNNTVSAAGQGNPSTTIINVESNPDLLKERAAAFENLKNQESQNAAQAANQIGTLQQQGQQNIANAAANANAKVEGYASGVKQTADLVKETQPDAFNKIGDKLNKAMSNFNNKRAVSKVLKKTDKAIKAAKTLQQSDPIAKMAAAEQSARFSKQLSMGIDPLKNMPTTIKAPSLSSGLSKAPTDMMGKPIKMGLDIKTPSLKPVDLKKLLNDNFKKNL